MRIEVIDHGPGVSEADRKQLFDEFVDGDGEQIQAAVEGAAAAVLGAAGIGDLPGDRPVGQVGGQLRGEQASAARASGIVAAVSTRSPRVVQMRSRSPSSRSVARSELD